MSRQKWERAFWNANRQGLPYRRRKMWVRVANKNPVDIRIVWDHPMKVPTL